MTKFITIEFVVAHAFINGIRLKNETSFEFSKIRSYIHTLQQYFSKNKISAIITGDIVDIKSSYNNFFEFTSDDSIITLNEGVTVDLLQGYFYINNIDIMNALSLEENVSVLFE